MTLVLLAACLFATGVLLGLFVWVYLERKRRRSLAFALTGEIAGILRIIETGEWEAQLRKNAGRRRAGRSEPKTCPFRIPKPVIFESNACRLNLLKPSLVREIAQFYALLRGVEGNAAMIAGDAERGVVLGQLEEALSLADDILRGLRPLLQGGQGARPVDMTSPRRMVS